MLNDLGAARWDWQDLKINGDFPGNAQGFFPYPEKSVPMHKEI